jgi:hypothetical protein
MIFSTYEPYDNDFTVNNLNYLNVNNKVNKIDKNDETIYDDEYTNKTSKYENECFICMETPYNMELVELKNISGYYKKCKCNAYIHLYCFNKWINIKCICPICRISMEKNILYIDDFTIPNTEYRYNSFEMDNNYNNNNYNNNYIKVIKICCSVWWLILIMYTIYYICINVNIK